MMTTLLSALTLVLTLGTHAALATTPGTDVTSTLMILGEELGDALAFDRVLGVLFRLALLWLGLQAFERTMRRAERWRLSISHTLEAWAPTVRLTVGGLMVVVIIDALTPEQAEARALVAAGLIITVLWSGQAVLRNAAAGAVIIARRAVRVGEHLRVGEVGGRVISVTLRGVELEDADGSRTFVPGLLLHTETTTHGPSGARASSVELTWRLSSKAERSDPEELRSIARRLALMSPRRAPGTPVLVHQVRGAGELRITLTPYDRSESDALRLEVIRRLTLAFEEEPTSEDTPTTH